MPTNIRRRGTERRIADWTREDILALQLGPFFWRRRTRDELRRLWQDAAIRAEVYSEHEVWLRTKPELREKYAAPWAERRFGAIDT